MNIAMIGLCPARAMHGPGQPAESKDLTALFAFCVTSPTGRRASPVIVCRSTVHKDAPRVPKPVCQGFHVFVFIKNHLIISLKTLPLKSLTLCGIFYTMSHYFLVYCASLTIIESHQDSETTPKSTIFKLLELPWYSPTFPVHSHYNTEPYGL